MYKLFRKFRSYINHSNWPQTGHSRLPNVPKLSHQPEISTHTNLNISKSLKGKGNKIQFPTLGKMMTNYQCPLHLFSTRKLTKQQIQQSTYSQLVDKIINLYNYKQYKIPSALALLQIHHQYQIFKPGHWVLDVGSGPNWAWTDLALKLTRSHQDQPNTNKVISNDLKDMPGIKENHTHVTGDFNEEPVRTKIALNLIERQLDVILIDATPQYTGNQASDADYTMQIFLRVMQFSSAYLKKGGTIIFKTIESSLSLQNENQAKFYFNEVHRYKSSSFRINSPCFFYILRGYMITENLKAVENFLTEYKKTKDQYTKTQVVQKYKEKYNWDPVFLVKNEAKNTVMRMREQGAKNKDIVKLYENDPYVKIQEIIKLFEVLESNKSSKIQKLKAENQLFNTNNEQIDKMPQNQQQFAEVLFENIQKIDDEQKQKKKEMIEKKKNKKNLNKGKSKIKKQEKEKVETRAPLAQDQVYMKSTKINSDTLKQERGQYNIEDLYGYNPDNPTKSINRSSKNSEEKKNQFQQLTQQFNKLASSFPEVERALGKNNQQFQKKYQQANQFFTNLAKEDMKNNSQNQLLKYVKKKKSDSFWEDQQQNQQEDDEQGIRPKKKLKQKQKDLKKTSEMSSQFDFDEDQNQKRKEKEIEDYLNNRGDIYNTELQNKIIRQFNNESKVEYLTSKPRKADRKMNNGQKKANDSNKSYFKLKNKNK